MEFFKRHLKAHQQVAFLLYPITALIAFLYSVLGQPPATYFSQKQNVLNVYFVKVGWFWVTCVYLVYLSLVVQRKQPALVRFLAVTGYWYLVTQWCFGPSVIDRIYVLTGGGCEALQKDMAVSALGPWVSILEQRVCRKAGGLWHGGHDISGHCVILIHASMFFWEELAWVFYRFEAFLKIKKQNSPQYFSILAIFALAGLWWFMLFQTGVYFHGHFEIFSGTFFGLLGWAILYLGVFPNFLESPLL